MAQNGLSHRLTNVSALRGLEDNEHIENESLGETGKIGKVETFKNLEGTRTNSLLHLLVNGLMSPARDTVGR